MPTARDYIVWKEKVSLYLDITGYEQTVVLGKLLLKMQGRVAEFVLLTFTGNKRRQPNCVHELCACLDSVILGDLTLMVQKGVRQLTTFNRGSSKMEQFLNDFQVKVELVPAPERANH